MQRLVTVALLAIVLLACGPSRATEQPLSDEDRHRRSVGAMLIVTAHTFQAFVMGLAFAELATVEDSRAGSVHFGLQLVSLSTVPLSAVGYGLFLGAGSERKELLGASLGAFLGGLYAIIVFALGLECSDQRFPDEEYGPLEEPPEPDSFMLHEFPVHFASFIAGVAGFAAGLGLLLQGLATAPPVHPVAIAPWIGPGGQGVVVAGRF